MLKSLYWLVFEPTIHYSSKDVFKSGRNTDIPSSVGMTLSRRALIDMTRNNHLVDLVDLVDRGVRIGKRLRNLNQLNVFTRYDCFLSLAMS